MIRSVRFFFNDKVEAVEALLLILEDARKTTREYAFGSTSIHQILDSGLLLQGDIEDVEKLLLERGLGSMYAD